MWFIFPTVSRPDQPRRERRELAASERDEGLGAPGWQSIHTGGGAGRFWRPTFDHARRNPSSEGFVAWIFARIRARCEKILTLTIIFLATTPLVHTMIPMEVDLAYQGGFSRGPLIA